MSAEMHITLENAYTVYYDRLPADLREKFPLGDTFRSGDDVFLVQEGVQARVPENCVDLGVSPFGDLSVLVLENGGASRPLRGNASPTEFEVLKGPAGGRIWSGS